MTILVFFSKIFIHHHPSVIFFSKKIFRWQSEFFYILFKGLKDSFSKMFSNGFFTENLFFSLRRVFKKYLVNNHQPTKLSSEYRFHLPPNFSLNLQICCCIYIYFFKFHLPYIVHDPAKHQPQPHQQYAALAASVVPKGYSKRYAIEWKTWHSLGDLTTESKKLDKNIYFRQGILSRAYQQVCVSLVKLRQPFNIYIAVNTKVKIKKNEFLTAHNMAIF